MDRFLRIAERGACNGKRKHQRLLRGFAFRPQLSLFLMPGQRAPMIRCKERADTLDMLRRRASQS